jgi:hypothetical protein
MNYLEYLASPEWAAKRQACIDLAGGRCDVYWEEVGLRRRPNIVGNGHRCRRAAFQAHHKTYERLGNELIEDLVACCGSCHRAIEMHLRPQRFGKGDPELLGDVISRLTPKLRGHG